MSILTVVQKAAALCGFAAPATAVGNSDPTIGQFIAYALQEGDDLAISYDWRNLKVGLEIFGDGTTTQFMLADDFDRFMTINPLRSSAYPSTPMPGPLSDDEMLDIRARVFTPAPSAWRLLGVSVEFYPALGAAEVVVGEYRSSRWILANDSVTRNVTFLADTDVCLVPEQLVVLGAVWRWKQAKGLEYAEDFRTSQTQRQLRAAHDHGSRVIHMSRYPRADVVDSWWPGTITPIGPTVT